MQEIAWLWRYRQIRWHVKAPRRTIHPLTPFRGTRNLVNVTQNGAGETYSASMEHIVRHDSLAPGSFTLVALSVKMPSL
jgi:hypothetical protein